MDNTPLNKELISDTSKWRLYLRIANNAADVMLYNPIEDNSLIYRKISLDSSDNETYFKSLENAVYDNPLLLSDFAKISILVEDFCYLLIPECVTDTELQESLFAKANTGYSANDTEIIADDISQLHARMLFALPHKVVGFLRRAFVNPQIFHHQTPLLRYFADRRRHGNNAKMFVHLREKSLDVMVYGNEGLRMANTFRFSNIDDAVYYILAIRQDMELNPEADELLISGDADLRRKITETLKKFITHVMPVIFPGIMFRAGKNALSVPFDLIVMPLCE